MHVLRIAYCGSADRGAVTTMFGRQMDSGDDVAETGKLLQGGGKFDWIFF